MLDFLGLGLGQQGLQVSLLLIQRLLALGSLWRDLPIINPSQTPQTSKPRNM
jgi:hypothetical protein